MNSISMCTEEQKTRGNLKELLQNRCLLNIGMFQYLVEINQEIEVFNIKSLEMSQITHQIYDKKHFPVLFVFRFCSFVQRHANYRGFSIVLL